jgi:hypothetical protein
MRAHDVQAADNDGRLHVNGNTGDDEVEHSRAMACNSGALAMETAGASLGDMLEKKEAAMAARGGAAAATGAEARWRRRRSSGRCACGTGDPRWRPRDGDEDAPTREGSGGVVLLRA